MTATMWWLYGLVYGKGGSRRHLAETVDTAIETAVFRGLGQFWFV